MKKKDVLLQITPIAIISFALMFFVGSDYARAQAQPEIRQSVEQKFEQYRAALKEEHQIDIKNFKDRIPGGVADGKAITNYDLNSSFWA